MPYCRCILELARRTNLDAMFPFPHFDPKLRPRTSGRVFTPAGLRCSWRVAHLGFLVHHTEPKRWEPFAFGPSSDFGLLLDFLWVLFFSCLGWEAKNRILLRHRQGLGTITLRFGDSGDFAKTARRRRLRNTTLSERFLTFRHLTRRAER